MNIAVMIGSLRKESLNRKLYSNYASLSKGLFEFTEIDLQNFPHYNQDIQDQKMPESVVKAAEQISQAKAVLFVTPEYNYSIPGVLKNAIDWLSRVQPQPFAGKPAAILGASMGKLGTARAQYDLRKIGVFLDIHFLNKPEVMLGSAHEAFDEKGWLKDEKTKKFLQTHIESFKSWVSS